MKHITISFVFLVLGLSSFHVKAQELQEFKYYGMDVAPMNDVVRNDFQFNGFTNYWHDTYTHWYSYGNLFKMAIPDVEKNILQSKVDIAEDLGLPGLQMQEGFISNLLSESYKVLEQPDRATLEQSLRSGNVLVYLDPQSSPGKELTKHISGTASWPEALNSHQYGAADLKRIDAFILEAGEKQLFVVSSTDRPTRDQFKALLDNTRDVVQKYDFHKGWFGIETLLKSVTCTKGHPLEVIGTGMNEGNSWFVFSGLMDYMAKNELDQWIEQAELPVVTDVGYGTIFGLQDWNGYQFQRLDRRDLKVWVDYAAEKGGYVFRNVMDTLADPYQFDGYFASEGNKGQIDNEDIPFVLRTGYLDGNATSSMVLFLEKGEELSRESMWQAILDRREVGVLEKGKMLGPAIYRNALQILLLDRDYLEDYFGDRISLVATTEGYDLQVTVTNTLNRPISGQLDLSLPEGLTVEESSTVSIKLPPGTSKTQHFTLQPGAAAMDQTNPVSVHFKWEDKELSTLTMLDLPPVISVHRLLYGHAPYISYPISIHNYTGESSFPVNIQVVKAENEKKVVYETSQICTAGTGTFEDMTFELELSAGHYRVQVSALGLEYTSQLGIGLAKGSPEVYETDLNSDGINEYRMENDSVQITLLTTGARVIEYHVKSRNDNVLFKLWPEKVDDHKRPFRERAFYPYGGFEDFLGQGSMENHQVYDAKIVREEGDYVRVRMWTDYFGNRLEKTFTLYDNTPLLEVRFALTFKNPEANVLGPQPILALGKKHWTEDVFTIPEIDGLKEYRMVTDDRFGQLMFLKEGWNAGYDTQEDISFVGAFPVDQPLF
ncbi:MAG: hypothetical protein U9R49_10590, partial [Bacteroidota bacterium]|nr:hypothetical protein [Bacteroidota bacterium]